MYLIHTITIVSKREIEARFSSCDSVTMHLILVDGSYFVFHRAHSINAWWRRAVNDTDLETPWDDPNCVNKFESTFVEKVNELPKRIGAKTNAVILVARDCPRSDIWRNTHLSSYKDGRAKDLTPMSMLFTKAYRELFPASNVAAVMKCAHLEADDCIALAVQHLRDLPCVEKITIIANDRDYSQLLGPNVEVRMLGGKGKSVLAPLTDLRGCSENGALNLFVKIVCGDKSDNISGVFPRCGPKTAEKMYFDPSLLERTFEKHPGSRERFAENRRLIDFREIPSDLANAFSEAWLKTILLPLVEQDLERE